MPSCWKKKFFFLLWNIFNLCVVFVLDRLLVVQESVTYLSIRFPYSFLNEKTKIIFNSVDINWSRFSSKKPLIHTNNMHNTIQSSEWYTHTKQSKAKEKKKHYEMKLRKNDWRQKNIHSDQKNVYRIRKIDCNV